LGYEGLDKRLNLHGRGVMLVVIFKRSDGLERNGKEGEKRERFMWKTP